MKIEIDDAGAVTTIVFTQPERNTLRNAVNLFEQAGWHLRGTGFGDGLILAGETASKLLLDTQKDDTPASESAPQT